MLGRGFDLLDALVEDFEETEDKFELLNEDFGNVMGDLESLVSEYKR